MVTLSSGFEKRIFTHRRSILTIIALLLSSALVGLVVFLQYNIILAVIGLILTALFTVMFIRPELTTVIVLFVMYANLTVVAIRFQNVPEILAASFFLLLGLPLLNHLIVHRRKIVVNKILFLMLVYLGFQLISAAFSAQPRESVGRIINYVIEGAILYFLVINVIRRPTMLRKGIWALILAGVLMGSISMYQELTGSYDNDFGGLAQVKDSEIDTGRVNYLGQEVKRFRLAGPVGSKNRYAQIMVVLLPLALFRIWAEQSRILKVLAALSCVPIVSGALLTFSRGAGVSIIITLLAIVFLRAIRIRYFILIGLAAYLLVILAIPDYLYRISTVTEVANLATGDTEDVGASFLGRATVNLAALDIFLDHPILGVGPGQTNLYTYDYGNEVGYRRLEGERRAHNMYLEELADIGIFGFSTFMSIILITLYQLERMRRQLSKNHPDIAYTASGFLLAIIAYLATALFLHLSYVRYFWLMLALAGVVLEIYKLEAHADESREYYVTDNHMVLNQNPSQ